MQTAHTFLESRHPEVTKNLYYVLSTRRCQINTQFIRLQLMGYNRRPTPLINFSKFFQPGHSYSNPTGYSILGEIPPNSSFQDIYSFCVDEYQTNLT